MKQLATIKDIKKILNINNDKRCRGIKYSDLEGKINHYLSTNLAYYDYKAAEFNSCSVLPKNEIVNSYKIIGYEIKNNKDLVKFSNYKRVKINEGEHGVIQTLIDDQGEILMIIKKSKDNAYDLYYEGVIGIILNEMRRYVPNFSYTFGVFQYKNKQNLFQEYIEGVELHDCYKNLTRNDIQSVFIQIANVLNISYTKLKYNHNDLHLGNILIKFLDKPICIPIYFSDGRIKYHLTKTLAYIIDYGFSRLEYKDKIFVPRDSSFNIVTEYESHFNPNFYDHITDMYRLLLVSDEMEGMPEIFKDFFGFYDQELIKMSNDIKDLYEEFDGKYYEVDNYQLMRETWSDYKDILCNKYYNFEKYFIKPITLGKIEDFRYKLWKFCFSPPNYMYKLGFKNAYYGFIEKFNYLDTPECPLTFCKGGCIDYRTYLIQTVKDENIRKILERSNLDNYETVAKEIGIRFPPEVKNKFNFFLNRVLNLVEKK